MQNKHSVDAKQFMVYYGNFILMVLMLVHCIYLNEYTAVFRHQPSRFACLIFSISVMALSHVCVVCTLICNVDPAIEQWQPVPNLNMHSSRTQNSDEQVLSVTYGQDYFSNLLTTALFNLSFK